MNSTLTLYLMLALLFFSVSKVQAEEPPSPKEIAAQHKGEAETRKKLAIEHEAKMSKKSAEVIQRGQILKLAEEKVAKEFNQPIRKSKHGFPPSKKEPRLSRVAGLTQLAQDNYIQFEKTDQEAKEHSKKAMKNRARAEKHTDAMKANQKLHQLQIKKKLFIPVSTETENKLKQEAEEKSRIANDHVSKQLKPKSPQSDQINH